MTGLPDDRQRDPSSLTDDELSARYRETGSLADRDELILRYLPRAERLAASRMHGRSYRTADEGDLKEIAHEALFEAFNTHNPQSGPFGGYVELVVEHRVDDFLRNVRRDEAHYRPAPPTEQGLEHVTQVFPASLAETPDPAALAEEHEQRDRFNKAVEDLPGHLRIVARVRCAGMSLRTLSDKIGIPYKTICAWNREAKAQLKRKLSSLREEK